MDSNSSHTQAKEDQELLWFAIQTSLGTTVFKYKPIIPPSASIIIHDACSVVQRPSIYYMAKNDPSLLVYSPDEALKLGYTDSQGRELEEVHGDMVDDYIPMYPDSSPGINTTILYTDKIIFMKCLGRRPDIDTYVAQRLGRTPVKEIHAPTKDTTEQRQDEQRKG